MNWVFSVWFTFAFLIYKCRGEDYDKENLKKLTEYRQQHRKTVDGRLCAAAFVQDDQTYTDCTKSTDPNGVTGREWCYVEVQLIGKGTRDWEYCKGVINYDIVRSKARIFFRSKSINLRSAVTKLDLEHKRLVGIYEKYEEICGTTSELVNSKIHEINDIAKNVSRQINKLLLQASSISNIENNIIELEDEVEINKKFFLENKKNCSILKGYAVEDRADGLIGSYYDNAYFSGYPLSIVNDKYINFIWDTGVPVENIPYQHFSIRWDGYLKIPQTDMYTISVEHDCGVRIYLDNTPIIIHNMPNPREEESEEMRPVHVLPIEKMNAQVHKSFSEELYLKGGKKYKFRVEYFHLSTVKYENPDLAHIILFWKSKKIIKEEIIQDSYFYQGNVTTPLHITELKGDEYELMLLENGEYAYINHFNYFVNDIPSIYERSKAIRTKYDDKTDSSTNKNGIITFRINTFSKVFIAIPKDGKMVPLNDINKNNFINTNETLSIYKMDENNSKVSEQKIYSIYYSDYFDGDVIIKNEKPVPFLIFVVQNELQSINNCKGYVQVVSLTNSPYFNSCYASSYVSDKFNCNAGFSGFNDNKEYGTWKVAEGKSLGQYMTITFKYDIDIYSFTFKPLITDSDLTETSSITELSLYFDNIKQPQIFTISPGHHHYKLNMPIKTKNIKIVISKVNDAKKNDAKKNDAKKNDTKKEEVGGNINFYGIPCTYGKEEETDLEKKNEHEINIYFKSKNIHISSKPLSWIVDNGLLKQKQGILNYGWKKLPTPIEWPQLDKKDIDHTGISFFPNDCIDNVNNDSISCDTTNTWSIDLLHEGTYYVAIEIGSPTGNQEINSIQLNGEMFINNMFLKPKQYTKVTSNVFISKNKTLEITTNTKTVIQSIQIIFLHN
ncbi:LCCL domain-containing protein, putative [Hepatocystis sp. ex Piliocolobus tephrosceles]|nr:LCCL domain-containing protein, putative [Hepatocystis sp. ex Piliocolobus tephrosceles]